MDDATKTERISRRIIVRLAREGFSGLRRAALVEATSHGDYSRGAAALDALQDSGTVELIGHFYRLSRATVDELARTEPELVAHWLTPGAEVQWDRPPLLADSIHNTRARHRIVAKLAKAGFEGLNRSEILLRNSYGRDGAVLDQLYSDGMVERVRRKYRLSMLAVDELAFTDPDRVHHWFDLSLPWARDFRRWRIDGYTYDVMLPPIGQSGPPRRPPYHYGSFDNLTDDEIAQIDKTGFWEADRIAPEHAGSFWA